MQGTMKMLEFTRGSNYPGSYNGGTISEHAANWLARNFPGDWSVIGPERVEVWLTPDWVSPEFGDTAHPPGPFTHFIAANEAGLWFADGDGDADTAPWRPTLIPWRYVACVRMKLAS